jgi:glycosyltransferase involved in cell wall biosynthesis
VQTHVISSLENTCAIDVESSEVPAAADEGRPASWRQMRLAYLTTQYPKVSHTFIRRELRELENRGHYVLRLAIRSADSAIVDPADLTESQKTIHCLGQPLYRLVAGQLRTVLTRPVPFARAVKMAFDMGRRSERGLLRHLAYLGEAAWLLQQLQRHRIEHLHVHFGTNAAAVARLIRCMGGPPYSMTLHGPDEFDAPRSWRLGQKQADAEFVAAISDYCSAQLRRWSAPEDWSKIHVIRCGVNRDFLLEYEPIDPSSRTLVCVGRLCPQKGQLLLIEAMGRLCREGICARLVLAGDGEMRTAIERRVTELNLGDHVQITGWIDEAEVRHHLLTARAMVLPSFAEGLPVVIMEALALARPVISTYVAGIPELVRPGETGWLVPAGNVPELTAAMRQALLAPVEQLARMGSNGRRRVAESHNVQIEAGRLEELLLAAGTGNGKAKD